MLASALHERPAERRGCPVAGLQLQATCSHRVSQEDTVSTWIHPLRARAAVRAGCYPPQLPNLSLNSSQPHLAGQAQPGTWKPGKASPEASKAESHKPQSAFQLTASAGLKGQRQGPQGHASRTGHSLASSGGQGGARSVSHDASLSPLPGQHLGPTSGCGERVVAGRSPHIRSPSLLSLTSCSCGR